MSQEAAPHTFIAESRELLRAMEEALLTLERSPGDAEAVNAVFRAMHTIKGSSGVFGFEAIVEFTHAMEGVVDEVRAGRVAVDEILVALLLTCGDHVSSLIDCLETKDRSARLETMRPAGTDLLRQLNCYCAPPTREEMLAASAGCGQASERRPGPDIRRVCSGAWHVSVRFAPDVLRHGMDPLSFLRYLSTLGRIVSTSAVFDKMPDAAAMDPETCYAGVELQFEGTVDGEDIADAFEYVRDDSTIHILPPHATIADYVAFIGALPEDAEKNGQRLVDCGALTRSELAECLAMLRSQASTAAGEIVPTPAPAQLDDEHSAGTSPVVGGARKERKAADGRYVRVHAAKLDELIDLVGELVIASAGVSLGAQRFADGDLREATASMSTLVEEVRDGALALRMVPLGETFNRFNRVVRDLGRELGKDVQLVISGAATELDKSMVEKLNDPLLHLVRNALDHGIESTERRLKAGKPVRGQVTLNAYHETGTIVIEVADDGAGLDRDRILAHALSKGMVQQDQALTDHEVLQLVMEPGFSTAETLSSVSGRGVGMDVVRRNVEALRGSVSIESTPGQGTLIALRIPLTLAIIDGFLVGVGASTYVIPLKMVVECLELSLEDRQRVRESGYINLRDEVLPLLRLRELFDVRGESGKRENVVVVNYGDQRAGFVVDGLLGEFQTVIKPLGKLFDRLAGISGSTILGTGEVALIVDVPGLIQRAVHAEAPRQPRAREDAGIEASPESR